MTDRYTENCRRRYFEALAAGEPRRAEDYLWRAASKANLLTRSEELGGDDITPERAEELLNQLEWKV
jgi:hypothetical protein